MSYEESKRANERLRAELRRLDPNHHLVDATGWEGSPSAAAEGFVLRVNWDIERAIKELNEKARKQYLPFTVCDPRFPGRTDLPIDGPNGFVTAVNAVLDELKVKAPNRYDEVVQYLPEAKYDPEGLRQRNGDNWAANAGGLFAVDGSRFSSFFYTVLHETGHNVAGHFKKPGSDLPATIKEAQAHAYAEAVLHELGRKTVYPGGYRYQRYEEKDINQTLTQAASDSHTPPMTKDLAAVFLNQVYWYLLGRAPDPEGLQHYTSWLTSGRSREDVAENIAGSPECRDRFIRKLHKEILNREADPVGLRMYSDQLRDNRPLSEILGSLMGSDEYLERCRRAK